MRTRLLTLVSVVSAALFLGACGERSPTVAARVADTEISAAAVERAVERFEGTPRFDQLAQQTSEAEARRRFEQAYLSQRIRRLVLRDEAAERGIEVTEAQVEQQIDQIASQFPSRAEFEKAVEQQGVTVEELRDLVRDQLVEQELRAAATEDAPVGEEEARRYYESHRQDYEQTRVQHILVEDIERARAIADRLQRAPRSEVDELFARLAERFSTDPSNAKDAGRLGWVSPGQLVPDFELALPSLSIGEISDPVRTEAGVHVIRVTGRRVQPFEEVSGDIDAQLSSETQERAFRDLLEQAFAEADVEVNPRYGEFDPSTGQIVNASAETVPGAEEGSPGSGG